MNKDDSQHIIFFDFYKISRMNSFNCANMIYTKSSNDINIRIV